MSTKIKNIPFIGGDTMEFEFDFANKIFNSAAECPMTLYYGGSANLMTPSTARTGTHSTLDVWNTDDSIAYNKLCAIDNSCESYTVSSNGYVSQYMVELDLKPLCSSLFGGSTSAMQAALKGINIAAWAKGSGVNNGVQSNSISAYFWEAAGSGANSWVYLDPYQPEKSINITDSIAQIPSDIHGLTLLMNNGDHGPKNGSLFINNNNKLYLLIKADYASNGTIPSVVYIDYLNIKLAFARVPDVIAPIPITLPDTWSMLVKGVSPIWDNNPSTGKLLVQVYAADSSTDYELQYSGGTFNFIKWVGSTAYICARNSSSFDKFTTFDFLLEQTPTGKRMRVLQNSKTVEKYTDTDVHKTISNHYLTFSNHFNPVYADCFFNSVVFLPNKNFDDDTEAENILRGTATGFEEDELVTDGTFQNDLASYPTHGSGILVSPGKAIFTAIGSYINQYIDVLPNNKYVLDIEGNCANGIGEFTHGTAIDLKIYHNMMKGEFITGPHTTRISISMYPTAINQYVTSVSLKLKM